ncbi:MAG: acyl carrier protein [Deltaproteobacteria bacterium]|nr:acyl carrier protein [Deltaproteobacteria bacterium]
MTDARAAALLDFVQRNFAADDRPPPTLDSPLLSEQWIDSMGLTLLATFIEEEFDVPFDGSELRAGRLESVRDIVVLLQSKA